MGICVSTRLGIQPYENTLETDSRVEIRVKTRHREVSIPKIEVESELILLSTTPKVADSAGTKLSTFQQPLMLEGVNTPSNLKGLSENEVDCGLI